MVLIRINSPIFQIIKITVVISTTNHRIIILLAQDELGQYSYGYAGGPSAKSEIKTADGITRGGYSYIDANGNLILLWHKSDRFFIRIYS